MTSSPASMTPVEIDTVLARLWGDIQASTARLNTEYIALVDISRGVRFAGGARYTREAIEFRIEEHKAEIARLKDEARPYEVEFIKRPWNRYFLVQNDNGHVHRGMNCSTCFPTTEYAWLIDLADCDEDAMVEEWGERACTVCFPSAPTNPLYNRPARIDREAQAARQAEKAQRDAVKAEKSIVDVDGSPLRGEHGVIKTKVAARNELSGAIKSLAWYGPGHPTDFAGYARKLVAALRANAPEIDVDKVIANAIKAAVKDGGTYAGQVGTLLAGEVPAEAIEDSLDVRLQPALEALGAKVEVNVGTYATSLTATFPTDADKASLAVLDAHQGATDTNLAVLLLELHRRLRQQIR